MQCRLVREQLDVVHDELRESVYRIFLNSSIIFLQLPSFSIGAILTRARQIFINALENFLLDVRAVRIASERLIPVRLLRQHVSHVFFIIARRFVQPLAMLLQTGDLLLNLALHLVELRHALMKRRLAHIAAQRLLKTDLLRLAVYLNFIPRPFVSIADWLPFDNGVRLFGIGVVIDFVVGGPA